VIAVRAVEKRLDEVALVSVASVAVSVVMIAVAALRSVAKRLDEVLLVKEAFVEKRLVEVEFTATVLVANKFVAVAFTTVRSVTVPDAAERLVTVVEPTVSSSIVALVIVVVARVEVPCTVSVPCEVSDEVAVIDPPVSVLIVPVIAVRAVEKRLDEVALVSKFSTAEKYCTKKLVLVALSKTDEDALSELIVAVADVRERTVPLATLRSEIVVVAKLDVP
jgi:hypothetical protein